MLKKSAILFFGYFIVMILGSGLLMPFMSIITANFVVSMLLLLFAVILFKDHLAAEWDRFRAETPNLGRFFGKLI